MAKNIFVPAALFALITLASCTEQQRKARGPIVMGDSTTIVTESEEKYLEDMVPDLKMMQPAQPASGNSPSPATAPQAIQANSSVGKTYSVNFGDVKIDLTGIDPQQDGDKFKGSNNAALSSVRANFAPKTMQAADGKITKVQQRIITAVKLVDGDKTYMLDGLGTSNSGWETVNTSDGQVDITETASPSFDKNISNATIVAAVKKAAQQERLSRKEQDELVKKVANSSKATDAPLSVAIMNVIWKLEGKTTANKSFSKEIRVDIAR